MSEPHPKIFDFLYADHEKVASILSQLEEDGLPKETSIRAQRAKVTKSGFSAKLGGIGADYSTGRGLQYEVRQTYDPLWQNSRRLIGRLETTNNTAEPSLGQLRILEGQLIAFDQSVLSKIMSAGSMKDLLASSMGTNDSVEKRYKKSLSDKKKEADIVQTYIAGLGLSVQFVLLASQTGFWFNINREYLYLNETDIPLKHPINISGSWKVVGIVDALPHDQFDLSHLEPLGADDHIPAMISHLGELIGITAVMFGRKSSSYGLKPLAIYRQITLPSTNPGYAILAT